MHVDTRFSGDSFANGAILKRQKTHSIVGQTYSAGCISSKLYRREAKHTKFACFRFSHSFFVARCEELHLHVATVKHHEKTRYIGRTTTMLCVLLRFVQKMRDEAKHTEFAFLLNFATRNAFWKFRSIMWKILHCSNECTSKCWIWQDMFPYIPPCENGRVRLSYSVC